MAAILSWLAPRGSGSTEARDEGASPVPPSAARETPPLPTWLMLNLRKDWDVLNSPRREEREQEEVLDAAWSRQRPPCVQAVEPRLFRSTPKVLRSCWYQLSCSRRASAIANCKGNSRQKFYNGQA